MSPVETAAKEAELVELVAHSIEQLTGIGDRLERLLVKH